MVVDIAKLREQHGLVQAQAESRAVEAIQNRFGNVSYKQGHRRGFWDAMQFIAENPSALIPEPPTDEEREALVDHLNGMMDSLDESVSHDQIYEQLRIAWEMARALRHRGPITDFAARVARAAEVLHRNAKNAVDGDVCDQCTAQARAMLRAAGAS